MGRGQKRSRNDFIPHAYPKKAEAERGWAKGNHRGYQTALGGFPEGAAALRAPRTDRRAIGNLIRLSQTRASLPGLRKNRLYDLRELQIGGRVGTEVESIRQKQSLTQFLLAVE